MKRLPGRILPEYPLEICESLRRDARARWVNFRCQPGIRAALVEFRWFSLDEVRQAHIFRNVLHLANYVAFASAQLSNAVAQSFAHVAGPAGEAPLMTFGKSAFKVLINPLMLP